MSIFSNFSSILVSDMWVQRSDKHQRLTHQSIDSSLVGLDSLDTILGETLATISDQSDGVENISGDHRSEDIQLEVTIRSSDSGSDVVPHNLTADHGK